MGVAIVHQPTKLFQDFLEEVEGIEVLRSDADDHSDFDRWLEVIAARTSLGGRLGHLLRNKHIVWVDPNHSANNQLGHDQLHAAAKIEDLSGPAELDEGRHAGADVLLTSFGHHDGLAFRLLETVGRWKERPPVIVFAAPLDADLLARNRRECLRRGAWEYTTDWSELYRAIELVVGRVPGSGEGY